MTTATIVALTVAVCWLVVRDHRREVAERRECKAIDATIDLAAIHDEPPPFICDGDAGYLDLPERRSTP